MKNVLIGGAWPYANGSLHIDTLRPYSLEMYLHGIIVPVANRCFMSPEVTAMEHPSQSGRNKKVKHQER